MHTPGPWSFDGHGVNSESGERIAKVTHGPPVRNFEVNERHAADSQLIAAAPELLEACESLLWGINNYHRWVGIGEDLERAEKAIAKAKGG